MPYIYNTAADAAKSIYKKYLADLDSFNETMAKVNLNTNYTESGKQEFIDAILKDVNKACENYTKTPKTVIRAFCDQVSIELPEDAMNYDAAVANALKVIDMMGFSLTPEILLEAVAPLKSSHKKIMMITEIIFQKNMNSPVHYTPELLKAVDSLSDGSGDFDIPEFMKQFERIHALLDETLLFRYTFTRSQYDWANPNTFVTIVSDKPVYSVVGLSDAMNKCGDTYRKLQAHYPQYFTKDLKAGA